MLLVYWLPVVVWMLIIFSASGDQMSFEHSSRIIGPLISWLFPHMPAEAAHNLVVFVRKCGHLTEYAVLTLLWWRALRKARKGDSRPWRWAEAGLALLFVLLYASTDELHQYFVPSRQASVMDVLIDTTGGAAGLLVLWSLGRCLKHW